MFDHWKLNFPNRPWLGWSLAGWLAIGLGVGRTAQPGGALSGRIIYTSGGHGWTYSNSGERWYTQRGDTHDVVEDYGNLDQMNLFVAYCFNAGATVVPMRPVGFQTNEVVMDNISPGVQFEGDWTESSAPTGYFGNVGDVPYRFAPVAETETAWASYVPDIPEAGFYPVYAWALAGDNRTRQLYRIRYTGGETDVRVPHHMVGGGWVYLGTYYLARGINPASGAVVISNLRPTPSVGSVVVADAIRFGNGMGDVRGLSSSGQVGSVSGYAREEECSRYWVQRSLGVGVDSSIYDGGGSDSSDNVGAPARMARHMNREGQGSMFDRVYLGFHSNASGSANPTARGCVGLYNNANLFPGTATPNQLRLAQLVALELDRDMASEPGLEVSWNRRSTLTLARTDFAFGEINNAAIGSEFDATIIEVAFHDEPNDARLLRDPKARRAMARGSYQGVVRYLNQFGDVPLEFLPEPPRHVSAAADPRGGVLVEWVSPTSAGGDPTSYRVYRSFDGHGFGQPVEVPGPLSREAWLLDVPADVAVYFYVTAVSPGGESLPSATVGCRISSRRYPPVLYVNGFDRFDRFLAVRQTAGPGIGGTGGGVQSFDRVKPRQMNSFDYVVAHGNALAASNVPFDSCDNDVAGVRIHLANYRAVFWGLGQESTADETFSASEQAVVAAFLDGGGRLFVSGSELAWDLDRDAGPSAGDRQFLKTRLGVSLGGDLNDSAESYQFGPSMDGLFSGLPNSRFDDGTGGIYEVRFPDVLVPAVAGAVPALDYVGGRGGAAAVSYVNAINASRVVVFGFPFETMLDETLQQAYLFEVLRFFGALPPPEIFEVVELPNTSTVRLSWTTVPGLRYQIEQTRGFTGAAWEELSEIVTATGDSMSLLDTVTGTAPRRFYRVVVHP